MGLDHNGIRLVAYTKALEPGIESIAMLGRQSLHADADSIKGIFDEFNIPHDGDDIGRIIREGGGYCEPLLEHLGFNNIESFDFSDYEKPTHVHDFNKPLPPWLDMKYDLVLDGGSLEHIFNFPVALRNCMRMVKSGGVFATITPCNNLSGHGFYQFSPELYFSLMRGHNGFALLDMFCHELGRNRTWYRPRDPDEIKSRLGPTGHKPVMMLVVARRVADTDLPEFNIQQSDYAALWAGMNHGPETSRKHVSLKRRLRRIMAMVIPDKMRTAIRDLIGPDSFPDNFFTPIRSDGNSLLQTPGSAGSAPPGSIGSSRPQLPESH